MNEHSLPPWLRLVYDSADLPIYRDAGNVDNVQLKLPFSEPDVVVVIDVGDFELGSFRKALYKLKPKWVFDIRAAPRMDRLAGGRVHALREFERLGTQYLDIFGLIGVTNYRNAVVNPFFWTPFIEEYLRLSDRKSGPYLALLDDEVFINTVSRHVASSISHVTGRDVLLSRLTSDLIEESM